MESSPLQGGVADFMAEYARRLRDDGLPEDPWLRVHVRAGGEVVEVTPFSAVCTRPVALDCAFESICESCTFCATTIEFRPTLTRQRNHARTKNQRGREQLFNDLLARADPEPRLTGSPA